MSGRTDCADARGCRCSAPPASTPTLRREGGWGGGKACVRERGGWERGGVPAPLPQAAAASCYCARQPTRTCGWPSWGWTRCGGARGPCAGLRGAGGERGRGRGGGGEGWGGEAREGRRCLHVGWTRAPAARKRWAAAPPRRPANHAAARSPGGAGPPASRVTHRPWRARQSWAPRCAPQTPAQSCCGWGAGAPRRAGPCPERRGAGGTAAGACGRVTEGWGHRGAGILEVRHSHAGGPRASWAATPPGARRLRSASAATEGWRREVRRAVKRTAGRPSVAWLRPSSRQLTGAHPARGAGTRQSPPAARPARRRRPRAPAWWRAAGARREAMGRSRNHARGGLGAPAARWLVGVGREMPCVGFYSGGVPASSLRGRGRGALRGRALRDTMEPGWTPPHSRYKAPLCKQRR